MVQRQIRDWNDAYANAANIPGGERWPDAWVVPARAFRERQAAIGLAMVDVPYGRSARHRLDLFLPQGKPEGLVVFIHGGYWFGFGQELLVASRHRSNRPRFRRCDALLHTLSRHQHRRHLPGDRDSERAEFIRQSALLANVWTGLGAETDCVEEPDRHHFNVIDGLADPAHALTKALLAA